MELGTQCRSQLIKRLTVIMIVVLPTYTFQFISCLNMNFPRFIMKLLPSVLTMQHGAVKDFADKNM